MGPKTKSAHLLRWHYGDRVTMGQFSNSFPKHFIHLCEYAFRFDLSCSFCEYPIIFHCLHCSPSCFDPDSLLLAHLWLGLSWIYYISANTSFSSPKTSSRKPYTSSKQQERQKHSVETTINFSQYSAPLVPPSPKTNQLPESQRLSSVASGPSSCRYDCSQRSRQMVSVQPKFKTPDQALPQHRSRRVGCCSA